MKTNTIFRGIATALVTPMNQNGVDYERFGKFIDWQINQGINALVVYRTTGEAPTLTDEEKKRRSQEHTSELQSRHNLVCRLLLEKKK